MFPVREFEKRFRELLSGLDELKDQASGETAEAMDEMNAEFEDALFVIECINTEEEEWQEEFSDALEEFKDLCGGYRKLASDFPALAAEADRLDMIVKMAEANLGL